MLRDKFSKLDIEPTLKEARRGRNRTTGPARLAQRGRVRPDATPMPVAYPVAVVNWMRKRDLEADTPWNTYTRDGLPPTPTDLVHCGP